jgi:hypothetical protein
VVDKKIIIGKNGEPRMRRGIRGCWPPKKLCYWNLVHLPNVPIPIRKPAHFCNVYNVTQKRSVKSFLSKKLRPSSALLQSWVSNEVSSKSSRPQDLPKLHSIYVRFSLPPFTFKFLVLNLFGSLWKLPENLQLFAY